MFLSKSYTNLFGKWKKLTASLGKLSPTFRPIERELDRRVVKAGENPSTNNDEIRKFIKKTAFMVLFSKGLNESSYDDILLNAIYFIDP